MLTAPTTKVKNLSKAFYNSGTYPDPVRLAHSGRWASTGPARRRPFEAHGLHGVRWKALLPPRLRDIPNGGWQSGSDVCRLDGLPEELETAARAGQQPASSPRGLGAGGLSACPGEAAQARGGAGRGTALRGQRREGGRRTGPASVPPCRCRQAR